MVRPMRRLTGAVAMALLALPAAGQIIVCQRSSVDQAGFTTLSAAEAWFPAQTYYEIAGDRVLQSTYGPGTVGADAYGRKLLRFELEGSGGTIRVMTRYAPETGRYSTTIDPGGRYVQISGARGTCLVAEP